MEQLFRPIALRVKGMNSEGAVGVTACYAEGEHEATVTLYNLDCADAFPLIEGLSIDALITDPPYFLDRLASNWDLPALEKTTQGAVVQSLPAGMKFDPRQGKEFQAFMGKVAAEGLRVLKPGGFFLAFSAPRLYHRLGVAVEDAGFEVRDMWAWLYTQNQVKAMSVERFLDPTALSSNELDTVREELKNWKTPQVKSCLEPIVFAQKPRLDADGKPLTFLENWLRHHVGLVDINTSMGEEADMSTANIMTTGPISSALDKAFLVSKPSRAERGQTSHVSVKPLALMEQLIRATVPAGGTVLDPFNGSGSTGIAALSLGRNYIGFETSLEYFMQSQSRFATAFGEQLSPWESV